MELRYPVESVNCITKDSFNYLQWTQTLKEGDYFPPKVPDCMVLSPLYDMHLDCFITLLDMPFPLSMRNTDA